MKTAAMRLKKNSMFTAILLAGAVQMIPAFAASIALTENGRPRAAIVAAEKPTALENKAIKELVEHVKMISGAELQVVSKAVPAGLTPIFIGSASDPKFDALILNKGNTPSAFAIVTKNDGIHIRGLSDEGTLFGVYELLEQLGVRWYMPGNLGRVIPSSPTIKVQEQQTIQVPSMDYRELQDYRLGEWKQRMRMGGEFRTTGAHGIPPFVKDAKKLFASHPEYFALIGGERKPTQICLSNPDVFTLSLNALREQLKGVDPGRRHYAGMGPNDGLGFCECVGCKALDGTTHDPVFDAISITDRYVWFFNRMLNELDKEYPRLHIVWYVYSLHMFPPNAVKPHKRLVGTLAPISLDRIRAMDNPMSPERHILRYLIDEWSKFGCDEMYYRGYYNNLACPQFPVSQIDRVRNEIPALRQKGINVMRVEVIAQSWASSPLTLYVASKMMWNVNTDVDALLNEFYGKFYGPASTPMKAYHEAVEAAFRDTYYFTGSSYPYFQIYDGKRRNAMRGCLENAAQLAASAGNELYIERVRINRLGFDRLELFLDMNAARNQFDFKCAYDKMQEYYRLTDSMVDYVIKDGELAPKTPPLRLQRLVGWEERSNNKYSMFNRFFERPVLAGYQRIVKDGELVVGLPDKWDFLIDSTGIGEISGWQRPGLLGGNWQPMKTFSATWSDQGLHYYKGIAWYRTQFFIPEKFKGRKIYLWFGGVDEQAKVWVNGKLLGTSDKPEDGLPGVPGSFRPFDMNASDAVIFGQDNTLVVRVINRNADELGTGGIVAPVMFWSPKNSNWSPSNEKSR